MTELNKNIDGIACEELKGSNEGDFTITSSQLTRIFRCAWDDRINLAVALLGEVTVDSSGNTVQIPPKAHPEVPTLYAQRVRVGRFDAGSKISDDGGQTDLNTHAIGYADARLTVDYMPFVAEFGPGDQLITEEFDVSMEALEVEGSAYVLYTDTNQPYSKTFFKVIGQVEDQIVFHRSASNKRAVIKSLVGKLNATKLADTERGSMLMLGGRGRRSILTSGVEQWELGYKFRSRTTDDTDKKNEWQKVFIAGTGWVRLLRKDDTTKGPYDYGDFNDLFT